MQIPNLRQGSKEWLEFRKSHLGASDMSAVLELSPWKTPYQLWLEKTGKKEERKANAAMIHGIETEDHARNLYMALTGNFISPMIVISDEYKVMMASLDGATSNLETIVEIKVPTNPQLYLEALEDKIPEYYMAQIQAQLFCTQALKCDYFCYLNEQEFKMITVLPDLEFQERLLQEAKDFWKLVETDVAPEIKEDDFYIIADVVDNTKARAWRAEKLKNKEMKKEFEASNKILEALEDELEKTSPEMNLYFLEAGVKIKKDFKRGLIDYKALCIAHNIKVEDQENFRKPCVGYARFSIVE